LDFFEVPKSGPDLVKSVAGFDWFFQPLHMAFFGDQRREIGARFCEIENKTETYFWAEICSNYLRDTFTINIDLESDVNLEREVEIQKTRVYKPTLKLGFVEFALGNKH